MKLAPLQICCPCNYETYHDLDWMWCKVFHFRINLCRRYSWRPKFPRLQRTMQKMYTINCLKMIHTILGQHLTLNSPQNQCFDLVFMFLRILDDRKQQYTYVMDLIWFIYLFRAYKPDTLHQCCTKNLPKKNEKKKFYWCVLLWKPNTCML